MKPEKLYSVHYPYGGGEPWLNEHPIIGETLTYFMIGKDFRVRKRDMTAPSGVGDRVRLYEERDAELLLAGHVNRSPRD
jgi:hypothetical protein